MANRPRLNGSIRITAKLSRPIETVEQMFSDITAQAQDWTPVWPRVVSVIIEGERRIVASRGSELSNLSYGHTWRPADNRYLRRKARQGRGSVDLKYTGTLVATITSTQGVRSLTPKELRFGVRSPQAQYLNFVKMPFLGMSKVMDQGVTAEMQAGMNQFAADAVRNRMGGA